MPSLWVVIIKPSIALLKFRMPIIALPLSSAKVSLVIKIARQLDWIMKFLSNGHLEGLAAGYAAIQAMKHSSACSLVHFAVKKSQKVMYTIVKCH